MYFLLSQWLFPFLYYIFFFLSRFFSSSLKRQESPDRSSCHSLSNNAGGTTQLPPLDRATNYPISGPYYIDLPHLYHIYTSLLFGDLTKRRIFIYIYNIKNPFPFYTHTHSKHPSSFFSVLIPSSSIYC
jgi:hypothetical protein